MPTPAKVWPETPPSIFLIRKRWKDYGLDHWSNVQVLRLARTLDCTVRELGALSGLSDWQIVASQKRNRWPTSAGIIMLMLSNWYSETQLGLKKPPILPVDALLKQEPQDSHD